MKKKDKDIPDFKGTMTWNYRVMRYESGELGLHEVYYDDGVAKLWTQEPYITGDTVQELLDQLETMKDDIREAAPILDYKKL